MMKKIVSVSFKAVCNAVVILGLITAAGWMGGTLIGVFMWAFRQGWRLVN